jgi:hypothetical protein
MLDRTLLARGADFGVTQTENTFENLIGMLTQQR